MASSPNDLPRQTVVGEFLLDRETIRVWRKDKPLRLSMRQFRLLGVFMQQPDEPISFGELKHAVWGPSSSVEDETVAAEVARLRHAIGFHDGKNPTKSIRGVGFLFESEPSQMKPRRPRKSGCGLKAVAVPRSRQSHDDDLAGDQHRS